MITQLLQRPLAIFDIESTGLNKKLDRIIDLAIIRIHPDGSRDEHTFRVNPECPIPSESTAVHGITDADVADAPVFKEVAHQVSELLTGCDLGGFNLIHYDIPMLMEEFTRAEIPFSTEGRRIIDVQRIFHKKEPRDLTAALRFYCGDEHTGAHGALADVDATLRVLEAQFERYTDLPHDLDEIDALCNPKDPAWADATGKLKWQDGTLTVNFGQKQGLSLRELVLNEPGYLEWILKKDFPDDTKTLVRDALNNRYPSAP